MKNFNQIKPGLLNIQLKPGHYPVNQKARPIPLHLQEEIGKELESFLKTGQLEKVKQVVEDCFVSPVTFTVKKDKSVKIAFDSMKPNDSCKKVAPMWRTLRSCRFYGLADIPTIFQEKK